MKRRRNHPKFRDLHGFLLLDKPLHVSSNQALQAVRKLLRAAKGGHTGALDPLATGLLPLCFGEATKIANSLLGSRKAYLAECRLGVTTTTADLEGDVVRERPVPVLDESVIEAALVKLRGRIVQIPSAFSAIKQDGEALYLKARRGEAVQVPAREVDVYKLDLLKLDTQTLALHIECGSGTYVRSLVADLGEMLGCGAHVTVLRRLWVEPFLEPVMVTMEQLERAAAQGEHMLDQLVLPLSAGVTDLPPLLLDAEQSFSVSLGRQIPWPNDSIGPRAAAFGHDGRLLALVERGEHGRLCIVRGFNLPVLGEAG